jgi:hypothetical protein
VGEGSLLKVNSSVRAGDVEGSGVRIDGVAVFRFEDWSVSLEAVEISGDLPVACSYLISAARTPPLYPSLSCSKKV